MVTTLWLADAGVDGWGRGCCLVDRAVGRGGWGRLLDCCTFHFWVVNCEDEVEEGGGGWICWRGGWR